MGPRLFRRGNVMIIAAPEQCALASMGPRLFRRGNGTPYPYPTDQGEASMGPRLFRRGNSNRAKPKEPASGLLQWGHVFSDVEISKTGI